MPDWDGYDVATKIRAHEQNSGQQRLRIVALTATSMAEDRAHAMAAGFDDWISKPFERRVLLEKIFSQSPA